MTSTDSTLRASQIVEGIRHDLCEIRSRVEDLMRTQPYAKSQLDSTPGYLTTGIFSLAHQAKSLREFEITQDDHAFGYSLGFNPRGIGRDAIPACFVCGESLEGKAAHNIAAFVRSRENGERIVNWFGGRARLDYRENEPNWIQVKVGVCDKHLAQLEWLMRKTSLYGVIRQCDIGAARAFNLNAIGGEALEHEIKQTFTFSQT